MFSNSQEGGRISFFVSEKEEAARVPVSFGIDVPPTFHAENPSDLGFRTSSTLGRGQGNNFLGGSKGQRGKPPALVVSKTALIHTASKLVLDCHVLEYFNYCDHLLRAFSWQTLNLT